MTLRIFIREASEDTSVPPIEGEHIDYICDVLPTGCDNTDDVEKHVDENRNVTYVATGTLPTVFFYLTNWLTHIARDLTADDIHVTIDVDYICTEYDKIVNCRNQLYDTARFLEEIDTGVKADPRPSFLVLNADKIVPKSRAALSAAIQITEQLIGILSRSGGEYG